MGSKVFASDMLISEMVMPMQNSYTHSDYPKAATNLFGLAEFLYGFDEGIKDFEKPPKLKSGYGMDSRRRNGLNYEYLQACKEYYERNFPLVMRRLGKYQSQVLKAIEMQNNMMGFEVA